MERLHRLATFAQRLPASGLTHDKTVSKLAGFFRLVSNQCWVEDGKVEPVVLGVWISKELVQQRVVDDQLVPLNLNPDSGPRNSGLGVKDDGPTMPRARTRRAIRQDGLSSEARAKDMSLVEMQQVGGFALGAAIAIFAAPAADGFTVLVCPQLFGAYDAAGTPVGSDGSKEVKAVPCLVFGNGNV